MAETHEFTEAVPAIDSTDILNAIGKRQEAITQALSKQSFYIEASLDGLALVAAFVCGWLVSRFLLRRLTRFLPRISEASLRKPLKLLFPVFAVFFLSVMRPIAGNIIGDSSLTRAIVQVLIAWIIIRALFLLVRTHAVAVFLSIVVAVLTLLTVAGLMEAISTYLDATAFHIGQVRLSLLSLFKGTVILVLVFWVAAAFNRSMELYIHRSSLNYNLREAIIKIARLLVYLIAFLITLGAMGIDITALAVFGGAVGVGVGLGLQKLMSNFFSGMTLLLERSIEIGDLVDVGGESGFVRKLTMRHTLLETFDGREILIPNEIVMTTQVANWTHSNENGRVEVKVAVEYGSSPDTVMQLMLQAASASERKIDKPEPFCCLREFTDYGMVFSMFFWVGDIKEGRFGPQSDAMVEIVRLFAENGIRFAVRPYVPEEV